MAFAQQHHRARASRQPHSGDAASSSSAAASAVTAAAATAAGGGGAAQATSPSSASISSAGSDPSSRKRGVRPGGSSSHRTGAAGAAGLRDGDDVQALLHQHRLGGRGHQQADWTLVFPGRQHPRPVSAQEGQVEHHDGDEDASVEALADEAAIIDPFVLGSEEQAIPTSPSAILDFPNAPLQGTIGGGSVSALGFSFADPGTSAPGLDLLPEQAHVDPAYSSLGWSLPSTPGDALHQSSHAPPAHSRHDFHRRQSAASSSVLSLSTSPSSGGGGGDTAHAGHTSGSEQGALARGASVSGSTASALLVAPPSPSVFSAGTSSLVFAGAPSSISAAAHAYGDPLSPFAHDDAGAAGGVLSSSDGVFQLPVAPSTEAGGSSPKGRSAARRRRRRKARAATTSNDLIEGQHDDEEEYEQPSSRITSSEEDSDGLDERSSKRSNNSGSASASAAVRRRAARRAKRRGAAAAGITGTLTPNAQSSPRVGGEARLQLRGDGITVVRPAAVSASSTHAGNTNENDGGESVEEGKLVRSPTSASTRLLSAILRKLFTLEPDVLDAFLIGSEGHVLGHSSGGQHAQARTAMAHSSTSSGRGAHSARTTSTMSSRPRRTVRFAAAPMGEVDTARSYEYEYRTFEAAASYESGRGRGRGSRARGAQRASSSNPVLAPAQAQQRTAEAGETDAAEGVEEDVGDEEEVGELVKVYPTLSTQDGGMARTSQAAFEHPYSQTRSGGPPLPNDFDALSSSMERDHEEGAEPHGAESGFTLRSHGTSRSLDTVALGSEAGAGAGAPTMMEPTAWEALRALFDERLARQAYSFHEGIGLPLSLRLLRWVLRRSGVWAGEGQEDKDGRARRRRAGTVGAIGWDGVNGETSESGAEGRSGPPSEVGGAGGGTGHGAGSHRLVGEHHASAAGLAAVQTSAERREWERAWAEGVALAAASASASLSATPVSAPASIAVAAGRHRRGGMPLSAFSSAAPSDAGAEADVEGEQPHAGASRADGEWYALPLPLATSNSSPNLSEGEGESSGSFGQHLRSYSAYNLGPMAWGGYVDEGDEEGEDAVEVSAASRRHGYGYGAGATRGSGSGSGSATTPRQGRHARPPLHPSTTHQARYSSHGGTGPQRAHVRPRVSHHSYAHGHGHGHAQGPMYPYAHPSHYASYGDLPAIAASVESSSVGAGSALASPSPSALGLGRGTAGLGGAVRFEPIIVARRGGKGRGG